jgi:hypothetical protein
LSWRSPGQHSVRTPMRFTWTTSMAYYMFDPLYPGMRIVFFVIE